MLGEGQQQPVSAFSCQQTSGEAHPSVHVRVGGQPGNAEPEPGRNSRLHPPSPSPQLHRRRLHSWLATAAVLTTLLCSSCHTMLVDQPDSAATTRGPSYTVHRVVDGDTVELSPVDRDSDEITVRVLGIDTPETKRPGEPVECWGPEATQYAKAALLKRTVTVQRDRSQDDQDRYGRSLRYLVLPDGTDYSIAAARAGTARAYTYRRPVAKAHRIRQAETEARTAGRGLWGPPCHSRQAPPAQP
jgi:micrococcal nuclease